MYIDMSMNNCVAGKLDTTSRKGILAMTVFIETQMVRDQQSMFINTGVLKLVWLILYRHPSLGPL